MSDGCYVSSAEVDEPATQEDLLPGTQEDPMPATQEDPVSPEDKEEEDAEEEEADEAEEEVTDENGAAPSGSREPLRGLKRHRKGGSPQLARRADVAWNAPTKLSRQITIDRLPQESKRMLGHGQLMRQPSEHGIARHVINMLCRPRTWAPPPDGSFVLIADEVVELCNLAQEVLEAEPTLLELSAPVKIFGDIHGQFADLMRLFDQFGAPSRDQGGDINILDYLFLGDYVDRGKHSLEVICLLLALKVQYPRKVFLVRGNHESMEVNARDGAALRMDARAYRTMPCSRRTPRTPRAPRPPRTLCAWHTVRPSTAPAARHAPAAQASCTSVSCGWAAASLA